MKLQQNIKFKQAERILLSNGFVFDRVKGSHYQYSKQGKHVVITLKLNPCVWHNICKNNELLM